jgi:hypothetical protein
VKYRTDAEIDADDSSKWYALTSSFDNPFTWLRIGQWQELVYKLHGQLGDKSMPQIITDRPVSRELKNTAPGIRKNISRVLWPSIPKLSEKQPIQQSYT